MAKTQMLKKAIISFALAAGSVTGGLGQRAHVARELEKVAPDDLVNVIVRFRKAPGPGQHQIVRDLGGAVRRSLSSIRGGAYALPGSALESLAENPEVLSVSPDRPVHMLLDNTTAAVNAPVAWNAGLDGSGIGVAVIDSGISDHNDLLGGGASRIV